MLSLALVLAGLFGVVMTARLFLSGAVALSHRLGLPEAVIAAVVIAVGTSAPELAINLSAGFRGEGDVVIGNIVGSNIVNLGLGIGLAGLIATYQPFDRAYRFTAWLGLVATAGLLADSLLSAPTPQVSRILGLVLLVGFIGFIGLSIQVARNSPESPDDHPATSLGLTMAKLAGGAVGMAVAAEVTVANAVVLASALGIPSAVIGATVIAIGGSLPEIISCVIAARAGHPSVAIGNIVGSQVFNLLGILGLGAVLVPISFSSSLIIDIAFLAAGSAVFMAAFYWDGVRRVIAPVMIVFYIAYCAYLVSLSLN